MNRSEKVSRCCLDARRRRCHLRPPRSHPCISRDDLLSHSFISRERQLSFITMILILAFIDLVLFAFYHSITASELVLKYESLYLFLI
jgi:hypothetical protein